jgi:hypothetical protein
MVGPRLKSRLIRYLPAASVKQVGSQLLSVSCRVSPGDILLKLNWDLVRVWSSSGLVNRGRSQEDEIYFERWERMTYLMIKN